MRKEKIGLHPHPQDRGVQHHEIAGHGERENFFEVNYHAYEFDGVSFAPQHLTPALLARLVPDFDAYTTFCFTRHPYEKAVSEYHWLRKDVDKRKVRVFWEPLFRRWIRRELALKNMDHKLPQATYVEGCQHVFKFEDLHNEWENIARVMGVSSEVTLPRLVVGRQNTSRIASRLSDKTKRMIQELYPDDFEALGYDR